MIQRYGRIAICIPTYRRPESLELLLAEVLHQVGKFSPAVSFGVLVVDNDLNRSASEVTQKFGPSVSYLFESKKGVASVRNALVSAAIAYGADCLVFVDDDEIPSSNWLTEITRPWLESSVKMVAGPVLPIVPLAACPLLVRSGLLDRVRHRTGTYLGEAGTGNLLVSMDVIEKLGPGPWFDAGLNLIGGEDAHFTRAAVEVAGPIFWSDEAVVLEWLPPSRLTFKWFALRSIRTAGADFLMNKPRPGNRLRSFAGGCSRIALSIPPLAFYLVFARIDSGHFRRLFRGIGFVLASLGVFHREYRGDGALGKSNP
jgi:succinoglycan biosynthesis protein ExoM